MAQTITATDVELTKPVNAVFEQTFLRRAQQHLPYFVGTKAGQISKQQGTSTIKWRRIEQETPSTTALAELTTTAAYMQGRDSDTPTFTDVVATVAKYGQFYIVNEEVDLYNPNGTTDELVMVLGESAGRSLNQLQRNIAEDSTTQRFAGNVGSTGAVTAIPVLNDLNRAINELTVQAARTFTPLSNGSTNVGSTPILPSYIGMVHPDVAYDIAGMTGFQSVEKYAGQVALLPGEFGYYARAGRGVRFLMSEDASKDANTGSLVCARDLNSTGGTSIDTYAIVILGEDALGSVGLGKRHTDGAYRAGENKGSFEMIFKPTGSGGTSDPFNEIATLAWKAFWAGCVLNTNWARSIRVGATNLAN